MTPGCSGGGWLASYNPRSGAGYVIGMTSIGNGKWLASAVMGGAAANTYDLAVREDDATPPRPGWRSSWPRSS